MYNFQDLRNKIETCLQESFLNKAFSPEALYQPVKYSLSTGGKRLRPVLLLMAYNLYHDNIDNALMPAVGIEVFHNFTLVHDDIMDNSPIRRNNPTVHRKWDTNSAILSGDAMLITAYQFMVNRINGHTDVLDIFNSIALQVCEGQQYDMDFEGDKEVTESQYLEMITLKTSVLIAGSLKIGATLADADPASAQALYDFGLNLGRAFQLQDDYLDVYGDPNTFGKQIGGDIRANKKTFLYIKAREMADDEQRKKLDQLFTSNEIEGYEKVDKVINIYDALDIKTVMEKRINSYYKNALQHFEKLTNIDSRRKSVLKEFAASLMARVN